MKKPFQGDIEYESIFADGAHANYRAVQQRALVGQEPARPEREDQKGQKTAQNTSRIGQSPCVIEQRTAAAGDKTLDGDSPADPADPHHGRVLSAIGKTVCARSTKGRVILMQKSMYSLILSDAVVSRIDQLAYEKGMSRSQLIDQILG